MIRKLFYISLYFVGGYFILTTLSSFALSNSSFPYYCIGCGFISKKELLNWNLDYFLSTAGVHYILLWPIYMFLLMMVIITS